MVEIISLWASLLLQAGHLWMRNMHLERGLSPGADKAQFVLQHKCIYSWFRKRAGQSPEWGIMICKGTWGSDFVRMNVRALYWPQWKGIQVLNGFITSSIIADEKQNKTGLLIHSLQGNITLSSPQESACNGKAAIRRKAISGQTWKSQMWEGTADPENRPGKAGMLDTLNHKSRAALLPPSSRSEVRHLLKIHRSMFAGVLCPFRAADVCALAVTSPAPGPQCSGSQQHATPSLLQLHGEKGPTKSLQYFSTPCDPWRTV